MLKTKILVLCFLVVTSNGFAAQEISGDMRARLEYNLLGYSRHTANGSVNMAFESGLEFQLDIGAVGYSSVASVARSIYSQAAFRSSDGLTLGTFVGYEDWSGFGFSGSADGGVFGTKEFPYGSLSLAAARQGYSVGHTFVKLEGTRRIDERWAVIASIGMQHRTTNQIRRYIRFGGEFRLPDPCVEGTQGAYYVRLMASYINLPDQPIVNQTALELTIGRSFGRRKVLGARDWTSFFPAR